MTRATLSATRPNLKLRSLWWAIPLAAVIAAAFNAFVFTVGDAIGAFPSNVIIPNAGAPLTLPPVIFSSVVGVALGGIVFALLGRFTSRPVWIYRSVGVIVLILSFATPLTIPDAPLVMVGVLELMHVVAGVTALWLLPRLVRR